MVSDNRSEMQLMDNLQNGQNVPKKGKNSTFFTFGGQNMTFRNKIHKIKKFHHVLKGHVQLFFWGRRPIAVGRRPKMAKMCPKKVKTPFFWRVAPKISLSHEIKKFHNVLKGRVQLFFLGRRPIVVGRRPKMAEMCPKKVKTPLFWRVAPKISMCLRARTAAVRSRASRVWAEGPNPSPPQGLE